MGRLTTGLLVVTLVGVGGCTAFDSSEYEPHALTSEWASESTARFGVTHVRDALLGDPAGADGAPARLARRIGVQVTVVAPGNSSALQVGDIVVRAGDEPVRRIADIERICDQWSLTDPLPVIVRRAGSDAGPVLESLAGLPEVAVRLDPVR